MNTKSEKQSNITENQIMPDYISLENKQTLDSDIDKALGCKKPCIEYIVTMPFAHFSIFGYGFGWQMFGHSAVRIVCDDEDKVINIESKYEISNIVKIYDTPEYKYTNISQQGGIINRDMMTIRFENVDEEKVRSLLKYYDDLSNKSKNGTKKFNILFGPLLNRIQNKIEYGNCSKWISEGFVHAGILKRPIMWPRALWAHLYENNPYDTNAVYYKRVKHLPQRYGHANADQYFPTVAPLEWFRSWCYSDSHMFAKCIIEVPNDSMTGIVELNKTPYKPSKLRNLVNKPIVIIPSIAISSIIYYRFGRHVFGKLKVCTSNMRNNIKK